MKKFGSLLNLDLSLFCAAILQTRFLISSDMLGIDLTITQNDFSGTC
jgi:hypothetical protein